MSIREDIRELEQYLDEKVSRDKFTGTLTLTLNCNNGGIGRIKANLEQDIKTKTRKKG